VVGMDASHPVRLTVEPKLTSDHCAIGRAHELEQRLSRLTGGTAGQWGAGGVQG
jgi:hypothetical protein